MDDARVPTNNSGKSGRKIKAKPKSNFFGPYVLLQTIGEGEFAKVKLALHKETREDAAIKMIKKEWINSDVKLAKITREISALKAIDHKNIVKLYDIIETENHVGMVLEYAENGELFEYILANKYLHDDEACRLFAQLVGAISYLHQNQIVHRDLKLENILLDKYKNIKVTDFGFANHFDPIYGELMVTSCGSPCYAAPELVISNGVYAGTAVDVWSCGVILFAMVAGYLPFDDDPDNPDGNNINKLYKYILATKLEYPLHVGPLVQNLLMKILVANPAERVKLRDIRRHKWLERYRESFKEFDLFDEMQNEKSIRTQEFSLPNRENSQKDRIDGSEKTKPSVFGGEIESQFTYKKLDHAEAELFLQNTKQVEEKNKIKSSSGNRGSASSKMLQKDVSNRNSDSDVNQEQRPLTRREDSAISELSFRDSRRSNIRDSGLEYSIGKGNVLLNREHEQLGVLVGNGISSNLAHKSTKRSFLEKLHETFFCLILGKSKGKKSKASNSNILSMSQKPEFLKRMSYYKESPNPKLVTSTPPNMVMMCLLSVAGRFGYLVEVTSKDEKNRMFSQMTKRASGTNLIDQFSVRINCPVLGDVGGTAKTNSSEFEHKQSESEELTREAQNIIKEIIDEHRSLDSLYQFTSKETNLMESCEASKTLTKIHTQIYRIKHNPYMFVVEFKLLHGEVGRFNEICKSLISDLEVEIQRTVSTSPYVSVQYMDLNARKHLSDRPRIQTFY